MEKKAAPAAIFILLFLVLSYPAAAQEVHVGVYVLNVGKFEVNTGTYTVDFYLDFKCSSECSPEKFEFTNGRAASIDKLIDTPTEKFYRIQASLSQNIDLRQYPFDKHSLTIELEDKEKPIAEQHYIPDNSSSGIDPSVIIVGWHLDWWNATTAEHRYEPYDETFSRYIFSIEISRVPLTSFLKSFLPVFFMVFVGLLSLLLRADKVTTRLTLNISTLLAAVMFHVNLTSTIPPVGYLTFADKFMITTYIILILILFSGILLMRHTDLKEEAHAARIYKYSLYLVPAIAFFSYVFLFFS